MSKYFHISAYFVLLISACEQIDEPSKNFKIQVNYKDEALAEGRIVFFGDVPGYYIPYSESRWYINDGEVDISNAIFGEYGLAIHGRKNGYDTYTYYHTIIVSDTSQLYTVDITPFVRDANIDLSDVKDQNHLFNGEFVFLHENWPFSYSTDTISLDYELSSDTTSLRLKAASAGQYTLLVGVKSNSIESEYNLQKLGEFSLGEKHDSGIFDDMPYFPENYKLDTIQLSYKCCFWMPNTF